MLIKGIIRQGKYYDSVTLMRLSKEITKMEGIIDSAVVMGTSENKSILKSSEMFVTDFDKAGDTDLLIVFSTNDENKFKLAEEELNRQFELMSHISDNTEFLPKSFNRAILKLPEANLSLISVAGKYAADEAMKAFSHGLHVMMFSDNVSIDDELRLKIYAKEKGLLMMGPDCGTAIINGIPLAFANVVKKGNIGIVAASGTGLQEVSCVISNNGAGISQAIGTGGRDVKKEIGGIMFIEAFRALQKDESTKVIVLVSKPPHTSVQEKIANEIKNCQKPVVTILIGGDNEVMEKAGAICATTLEKAGMIAASLSKGLEINEIKKYISQQKNQWIEKAQNLRKLSKGKYIRGLFSGGTLCDEAQLILRDYIGHVYSNTPLDTAYKLKDAWKCKEHSIIDMGDDDFTIGRPHPMIDYSLRNKKMIEEASIPEVAVLLFDVVLGYGSNYKPTEELVPTLKKVKSINPDLIIICSITGTELDPQNLSSVKRELEKTSVIVMPSNAAASELTGMILQKIKLS